VHTERERCQSPLHAWPRCWHRSRTAWGTCARYGYASSPISPLLYRMYSKAWLGSPLQTRQLECSLIDTAVLQLLQSQPTELHGAGAQGWQRAPRAPQAQTLLCSLSGAPGTVIPHSCRSTAKLGELRGLFQP